MKTSSTTLRLIMTFCFMCLLPLSIFAAPSIFICGSGTAKLSPGTSVTLVNGDAVVWQKTNASGVPIAGSAAERITYTGTPGSADLSLTGSAGDLATAGEHYWVAHVIKANPIECSGDPSDPVEVYMLPPFTVQLDAPTLTYCVAGSTNNTSVLTASTVLPSGFPALPAGIDFDFEWVTGTTAGAGAVDSTDPKKFNMGATTAGSYTVVANVKYKATGATPLKSNGTACEGSATKTITATPQPGKPVISAS